MKCIGQTRGHPVLGLDGKPLLCPEWARFCWLKLKRGRERDGELLSC